MTCNMMSQGGNMPSKRVFTRTRYKIVLRIEGVGYGVCLASSCRLSIAYDLGRDKAGVCVCLMKSGAYSGRHRVR